MRAEPGFLSSPVDHVADELRAVGPHPHALDQTDGDGARLDLQPAPAAERNKHLVNKTGS